MTLALDGTPNGKASSTGAIAVTLTTSQSNDVIVMIVDTETASPGVYRTVTGISGGGLTWYNRSSQQWNGSTSLSRRREIWWAIAASPLSAVTFTATMSGGTDTYATIGFAVSGANTASPWDTNGSLPANVTDQTGSSTTPTVTGLSTSDPVESFIFAVWSNSNFNDPSTLSPGTGYTGLLGKFTGAGTYDSALEVEYKVGQLTSASAAFVRSVPNWNMVVDALQSAPTGSTGTWSSTEVVDVLTAQGHNGTSPWFVNASSLASQNAVTNLTLNLPSSRTTGNLLIGFVTIGNNTAVTWPAGWTPIDSSIVDMSMSYAYCYVTGSETAPNLTWNGSQENARGIIVQYAGTAASSPIGATNKHQDFSVGAVTMTDAGITTTAANSTVGILGNFEFVSVPTISGYAQRGSYDSTFALYDVAMSTLGSTSTAISQSLGSFVGYQLFGFEILAAGSTGTWSSTEVVDVLAATVYVAVDGPWISTGAIDVFAATGSPIDDAAWASTDVVDVFAATGTPIDDAAWHSTEADDVFAATVYVAVEGPWISTDTEDVLDVTGGPVSFDGPWHSTATKDVFAATGGPYPGGPWNSTATKDVFAATGYVPSIGLWHSTAKKDVFEATGYAPSVASWHSTEATDIFVSPTPASWASTEAPDRLTAAAYTPGESMEWVSTEPVDMVNATGYITDLGSWASPEAKDIFSAIGAGASAPKGRRIFLAC